MTDTIIVRRIEFGDADDPDSTPVWPPRFSFSPEAMILALPNAKMLTEDDQKAIGDMLRVAYEQGKKIGAIRREPK